MTGLMIFKACVNGVGAIAWAALAGMAAERDTTGWRAWMFLALAFVFGALALLNMVPS